MLAPTISRRGGGLLDCVRRLAQELERSGAGTRIFAPNDDFAQEDRPLWEPLHLELFRRVGPANFSFGRGLADALCASDVELLHTHGLWTYLSLAAIRWSKAKKRPIVISPQGMLDSWALERSKRRKQLAALLYERRHLQTASCVHAVTEKEMRECRAFGVTAPICIIPNGVDLPAQKLPVKESDPPWSGSIESGKKILLFLSRIHPKKGLPNLLTAWSNLKRNTADRVERDEWALVIAGWNQENHLAELQAQVGALGISRDVVFVGPVFGRDRDAAYGAADAVVLPSFGEGQPLAILEAWAHAKPVLMTSACNLGEGFTIGAALQIDPEPASIADGLRCLFTLTAHERKEMGKNGRRLVETSFSWRAIAAEMRGVYEWILGGGPKPASVYCV